MKRGMKELLAVCKVSLWAWEPAGTYLFNGGSLQLSCAGDDHYQELPSWVEEVMPIPDDNSRSEFNLSPVTSGNIKSILKSRSSGSSPGDDTISYHHLKKMPSTHHFLATLFSKILLDSQLPLSSWCSARIKLIHKGGDTSDPANFRPIALCWQLSCSTNHCLPFGEISSWKQNHYHFSTKRVSQWNQWHNGTYFHPLSNCRPCSFQQAPPSLSSL